MPRRTRTGCWTKRRQKHKRYFLAGFTVDGVSGLPAQSTSTVRRAFWKCISFGGSGIFAVKLLNRVFERNLLRQATLFAVLMPQ